MPQSYNEYRDQAMAEFGFNEREADEWAAAQVAADEKAAQHSHAEKNGTTNPREEELWDLPE